MSGTTEPATIRLLDRDYVVGVGAERRDSLDAAARLLDGQMREVRGANRMAAVDRVAVLAALNLAHELQQLRDEHQLLQTALADAVIALERGLNTLGDG